MSVGTISPVVLKKKFDCGDQLTLLDVREDHERSFCAIATTAGILNLHIPMRDVPSRVAEIPTDAGPVIVYCHHGIRSMVVALWLARREGFELFNLEGGINAWSEDVDPAVLCY